MKWARAAAALVSVTACARFSHGSFPAGTVFVTESMPKAGDGGENRGRTREYRDGTLVATFAGRVFEARDAPGRSLVYDWSSRTARRLDGGSEWPFNPCHDPNGPRIVALSPDGSRGVCASQYEKSNELVSFEVNAPERTRRVMFRHTSENAVPVVWVDGDRIAVAESAGDKCPSYGHYGDEPASLAIVDTRGKVLERGPCIWGLLAGSGGPVLLQLREDDNPLAGWFYTTACGNHPSKTWFSTNDGKSWQRPHGSPIFVDGKNQVFSLDRYTDTLYDADGRTVATGVFGATYAN